MLDPIPHGVTVIHRVSMEGFEVLELDVAPGVHLADRSNVFTSIRVTLAGELTEVTPYGTYRFEAGSLDFRPPGMPWSETFGPAGCRMLVIEISSERMLKFEPLFERSHLPVPMLVSQFGELPARIRRELHAADRWGALGLKAAILELVAESSRVLTRTRSTAPPPWIIEAQRFIETRFRDAITAADVASAAECDSAWLAESYRRFFGRTVAEAIRGCRVSEVGRILRESEVPLSEVALLGGFADASQMTHAFNEVHGMTPSQFRAYDDLVASTPPGLAHG